MIYDDDGRPVYSSVPKDAVEIHRKPRKATIDRAMRVYHFLEKFGLGHANAVPAETIARSLGIFSGKDRKDISVNMPSLTLVLLLEGYAVASSTNERGKPRGYFIPITLEEFDQAVRYYEALAAGNQRRARLLSQLKEGLKTR